MRKAVVEGIEGCDDVELLCTAGDALAKYLGPVHDSFEPRLLEDDGEMSGFYMLLTLKPEIKV